MPSEAHKSTTAQVFAQRLRYEREMYGWSQAKLAELLGTTANTVGNWERGITLPSPHFRERLYALLGKTASDLGFPLESTAEHKEASALVPVQGNYHRDRLLTKVYTFWIIGVLEHSLRVGTHMRLCVYDVPNAVVSPWQQLVVHPASLHSNAPLDTHIGAIYDAAGGELLILGEPGAGKTTLLLELAQQLIDRARQQSNHPIPVVFNLATWSRRQLPLVDWMIEELHNKYQVSRQLSHSWIWADHILPLLDGLDEVNPVARSACVEAINTYRTQHGLVPIVVCSRWQPYISQPRQLQLQRAICIQPLTAEEIDAYLAHTGDAFPAIQALLQHNPALQTLVTTPLMLHILTTVSQTNVPKDLVATSDSTSQQRQLLQNYVSQMLQRRQALYPPPQQTIHWLTWLAQRLHERGQTVFSIEDLQSDWLTTLPQRQRYEQMLRCILGALVGAALLGLFSSTLSAQIQGIFVGCIIGLLAGATTFTRAQNSPTEPEARWRISCADWRVGAQVGLLGALLFPLRHTIANWPPFQSNMLLLVVALEGWLFCTSIGVVVRVLLHQSTLAITWAERITWSWDHMLRALRTLAQRRVQWSVGLIVGGVFLILYGLFSGVAAGLTSALLVSLLFGFVHGWTKEVHHVAARTVPNQAMWNSLRHSLAIGIVGGSMIGVIHGAIFSLLHGKIVQWPGGLASEPFNLAADIGMAFLLGVVLVALPNGAAACLQHALVRVLLWREGSIPWNYRRFLDAAAEHALLRKVGGGYMFVHHMLLEYFAHANPQDLDVRGAATKKPISEL